MDLYNEMKASGMEMSGYPNTAVAAAFSILPGGGQFYNGQIGLGIVNMLFWPLSYLWAIPSAIKDASVICMIKNAEYYRRKKQLEKKFK